MNKKCLQCGLVNFAADVVCRRCAAELGLADITTTERRPASLFVRLLLRLGGLVTAIVLAVFGFYVTLLVSAQKLDYKQLQTVNEAIQVLDDRGFQRDTALLRYVTAYRATDNWLNATTRDENAYAATNFPFAIMTIYPEFYTLPTDATERAAVLLHEAQHLRGANEQEAYEFVWRNREQLGWTSERYGRTAMWLNVRKQTREFAPNLFVCEGNPLGDCTEPPIGGR